MKRLLALLMVLGFSCIPACSTKQAQPERLRLEDCPGGVCPVQKPEEPVRFY